MQVEWGETYDRRDAAGTPIIGARNMFYEERLSNGVTRKSWITRPGLKPVPGTYDAPLRAAIQEDGIFSGDVFLIERFSVVRVSGSTFTPIGGVVEGPMATAAMANTAADGEPRLVLTSGDNAYNYDGTTFSQIAIPNGDPIGWVAYLAGLFILGVSNSTTFYFMGINEAAPQALHYYNSESTPSPIKLGFTVGDELALVKADVSEFWQTNVSGDVDDPLSKSRTTPKGTANARSIAKLDNSYFFVGLDRIVYREDSSPVRVSTNAIEERLRADGADATGLIAWAFYLDGHGFYVLSTANSMGSFVYDVATQRWFEWDTFGGPWLASGGHQINGVLTYAFGGAQLYTLDMSATRNDGGMGPASVITSDLMGMVPVVGAPQRMDSFTLPLQGVPAARVLTLSKSDTDVHDFTALRTLDVTPAAVSTQSVTVRQLGLMREPGRLLKISGDGPWSMTYADVNEGSDA